METEKTVGYELQTAKNHVVEFIKGHAVLLILAVLVGWFLYGTLSDLSVANTQYGVNAEKMRKMTDSTGAVKNPYLYSILIENQNTLEAQRARLEPITKIFIGVETVLVCAFVAIVIVYFIRKNHFARALIDGSDGTLDADERKFLMQLTFGIFAMTVSAVVIIMCWLPA